MKKSFWCNGKMSRDELLALWISVATVFHASSTVLFD